MLFVAGMWFQDLWTYDFRRTEMCIIPYGTQMGEISFCAYNTGVGWRHIVEKMHQNATVAEWYREHGKHAVYANPRKTVPLPVGQRRWRCTFRRTAAWSSGLPKAAPCRSPNWRSRAKRRPGVGVPRSADWRLEPAEAFNLGPLTCAIPAALMTARPAIRPVRGNRNLTTRWWSRI